MSKVDIRCNDELYDYYGGHLSDGRPILNSSEFKYVTDKYGKDIARETLAHYIHNNRTEYPIKDIGYDRMSKTFHKLRTSSYFETITPVENFENGIIEKYEYEYDFDTYGLGVIDAPATFNPASDYFMNKLRARCSSVTHDGPAVVWEEGSVRKIWQAFGAIWRGVNNCHFDEEGKVISGDLTNDTYLTAFRLGTYLATQFKPNVARTIYEMCDAKKVLDTSMGWGDRLCGFMTSNAKEYVGCDPNPNTFKNYKIMAKEYSKLVGDEIISVVDEDDYYKQIGTKKTVTVYRSGAENIPWNDVNEIDCAFTSPPYFSTEKYNEGGDKEEDQSWSKFKEYESWRDDFYLPVAKNSFDALSDNGFLLVNIMDPRIHGKRYHSGDELVNSMKDDFVGQVGMRIMQRPHGKMKFTPEELREYMKKTYIENVWVFSKGSKLDLFRDARVSNLDSFF